MRTKNTPKEERERKDFRLPPVIPAVLYNGVPAWTAAPNFKETLSSYQKFEQHVLNFCYILFHVNRYREEDLYQAANLISSIFVLDQKSNYPGLVKLVIWLKNVIKPKLPEKFQKEVENILAETNPMEVEKMVINLETTLEEMQKEAEIKGKLEIARAALKKGFSINDIAEITGLDKETVLELKQELN